MKPATVIGDISKDDERETRRRATAAAPVCTRCNELSVRRRRPIEVKPVAASYRTLLFDAGGANARGLRALETGYMERVLQERGHC